jgi:hypothetical protein
MWWPHPQTLPTSFSLRSVHIHAQQASLKLNSQIVSAPDFRKKLGPGLKNWPLHLSFYWYVHCAIGSVADPVPNPDPPAPQCLGLLDPDPDPSVRGMDPDLDPSITKKKK